MTSVSDQTMNLIMERLQTIVASRLLRDPSLIAETVVGRVRLQKVHETLAVRALGLQQLLPDCRVATGCFGVLTVGRISKGILPGGELSRISPVPSFPPGIDSPGSLACHSCSRDGRYIDTVGS